MDLSVNVDSILEGANVGVWHQHLPSGTIIRNDVFLRLIQVTAEELSEGLFGWAHRIHPADRAQVLGKREQLLAGEIDAYWVDYRVRCSAGGWVSLRARVATTGRDSAGKPQWIGGALIDISREREYERRLHAIFDRPFQFVGLLTPEGILLETNRTALRDSGHSPEEALNKPLWEGPFFASSPTLQQQMKDGIARAALGELIRFETQNIGLDGKPRTMDFTLTPLRDDDGKVVNIIPEGRDITDLVSTREALRAAQQRLSTATAAANIGLWDVDMLTGQLWVNGQWGSMLNLDADELPTSATMVYNLIHPDDRAGVLKLLQELDIQPKPGVLHLECRMRSKDGSWRWIQANGRAVDLSHDGQALRLTGVTMDVTERKEAELRLVAAERLESIGRLAAGVAHEINTPVQYVNDSVYFIREGVQELLACLEPRLGASAPLQSPEPDLPYLKENLPAALERALDGLARIAEIVRSMKDFSHADQPAMSPVDLNRAIQSTLVVARNEYKYVANVATDLGQLPLVTCHGGQINQVILNLVINASHAIADKVAGTAHMGLITVRTCQEGSEVVIAVGDTGTGIPEGARARIFEPFFTTKELGRGTGQGLSIARNVVRSHGGALSFQTETGAGTTFYVRLPIEQTAEQEDAVAA